MAKPRTYVSQFTLRFGPATCIGQLVPVKAPEPKRAKMVTYEGNPVSQMYSDDDGNLYRPDELARAVENADGSISVVDPDILKEVRESELSQNIMDINVHTLDDVNDHLFPSPHNAYIMQPVIKNAKGKAVPDPTNDKWYDLITTTVREASDLVLMGICNLRNSEALYRLSIYQGHLMVQRMLYPEDLNQYEPVKPTLPPAEEKKALLFARKLVTPFELGAYEDASKGRIQQAAEVQFDPSRREEPAAVEIDFESTLDSLLG